MEQKNAEKYSCIDCDYTSSNKFDYTRHLSTRKHLNRTNENVLEPELRKKTQLYKCDNCEKIYKAKSGLWNHKKKCQQNNLHVVKKNDEPNYKDMFLLLVNENKNLQNTIIDQNKMLHSTINEIIPKIGNTNNTNTNNNTNNINIVVNNVGFLNDNCKNALSINDFIESITIGIQDLEYTGKKGLANGLAKIFLENYEKLPLQLRPLWCGDKKRKKLYIKEEEWVEDKDNQKTKEAIKNLTVKQAKNTNMFTKEHPDWMSNDKKKDTYLGIIGQTTADVNDTMDKIISNIADKTHLSSETKEDIQTIEK